MISLFFFFLGVSSSYANNSIVNKINVLGEKRLSESFIKKFVPDLDDDVFDNQTLNVLTKKLYMTGYFSNVELKIIKNTLQITIVELPIINNISFSGNDLLNEDQLTEIVSILPREIFNKQLINEAIERIRNEYQKIGRYLAEVKVKKIDFFILFFLRCFFILCQ